MMTSIHTFVFVNYRNAFSKTPLSLAGFFMYPTQRGASNATRGVAPPLAALACYNKGAHTRLSAG